MTDQEMREVQAKAAKLTKVHDLMHDEFRRATEKFGAFHNSHEGYAVIKEEVDELWDDIKANDLYASCDEAIQVAAMAIRYLFDLMPKDWEPDELGIRKK